MVVPIHQGKGNDIDSKCLFILQERKKYSLLIIDIYLHHKKNKNDLENPEKYHEISKGKLLGHVIV